MEAASKEGILSIDHSTVPSIHHTSQSSVNDAYGNGYKLPAGMADVGLLTTCADVVIVSHVDVKDQLLPLGSEPGLLYSVLHTRLVCTRGHSLIHKTYSVMCYTPSLKIWHQCQSCKVWLS